ncbi:unknown protein [Seminavis robusta]|uniref:Uncharacterized protein n=1 Tax=Seminavis robusta TaxID=568900 RepID=A0A9N8F699_9STRA|nr:unknown protein [Seminavis robusta]|eukprot:Sro4125_g353060.1 n/a (169) ;mRNA; f:2517-3023
MMMSSDSLEQQLSDSFEQYTDRKTSLSSALDSLSVTAKPKVSSSGLKMTPPIKSKSWTAPAVAIGIALLLFGRSSPLFSVSSLQKELIRDIVKEKTVADEDVSFTRENIQRNVAANATSTGSSSTSSTSSTTSVDTATSTKVDGSSSEKESVEQSPTENEPSKVAHGE